MSVELWPDTGELCVNSTLSSAMSRLFRTHVLPAIKALYLVL